MKLREKGEGDGSERHVHAYRDSHPLIKNALFLTFGTR